MCRHSKGRNFGIIILCIFVCVSAFITGCSDNPQKDYGVFLGINADNADRLNDYRLVVIEPSEFNADHIQKLHADGKTVYGYINVGALEEYRPYYDRFKHLTLDVYENWEDERWMDVSCPEWQSFVVNELGKQYADMGIDGFFIDNTDVCYHYQTDDIYNGLCSILKGLKVYDIPLIINGGDTFVSKCMDEGIALSLFSGINQESVFTSIDFENKAYGVQQKSETLYYQNYIAEAKSCGLAVYLLEYGASPALAKEIDRYCGENGFIWYNAESLELR